MHTKVKFCLTGFTFVPGTRLGNLEMEKYNLT